MTSTESTLPDLEPNAPRRIVSYADHLLCQLRDAFNRAELASSVFIQQESYREAALHAISLDRHVTEGGEPPISWSRARA